MATEGRKVFRRCRIFDLEYRSDIIGGDYMRRWTLRSPLGMLRLHHILRSDDDRDFHDHPMDFVSLILWGSYIEHLPDGRSETYRPGFLNIKQAEDLHRLELKSRSVWTFVVAGPIRRRWGFMTSDGWIDASKYDEWKGARK